MKYKEPRIVHQFQPEMRQVKIFTGSSHPELARLIVDKLGTVASPAILQRFSNSEMAVELSVSVRNEDVFIIQSGSTTVNDHVFIIHSLFLHTGNYRK